MQCELLLVATFCVLLSSKFPLKCIVGKQRKGHKSRSLNYCFFANQPVLFFAMRFLPHKGFALPSANVCEARLIAKCECFWSSRTDGSSSYLLLKIKQFCSKTVNFLHNVPPHTNCLSTSHWHAFRNALH